MVNNNKKKTNNPRQNTTTNSMLICGVFEEDIIVGSVLYVQFLLKMVKNIYRSMQILSNDFFVVDRLGKARKMITRFVNEDIE